MCRFPSAQFNEPGQTIGPQHDGLAIDRKAPRFDARRGSRNRRGRGPLDNRPPRIVRPAALVGDLLGFGFSSAAVRVSLS
jgi:hypothetical protein